ncbi:Hemoglobin (fragment) [Methylocella tundrae]|uniref:Hemoglobin n=1 Tax=Methylocella tundrae TaxID=227605 RepID=A0A8B6MD10_METTU
MTETPNPEVEESINNLVREFYREARQDSLLGPIFNSAIEDWDVHLRIVADFWSKALLKTERYTGSPFPLHMKMPVELEHFERWLALFEETAKATLPAEYGAKAIAKVRHMAESFKAGIFIFVDKNGRPARHPG